MVPVARLAAVIFFAACTVQAASADQVSDAAFCATISDSLLRLNCFDKVFPRGSGGVSTSVATQPEASATQWEIREEKSPMDDSTTIIASLTPIDHSGSNFGRAPVLFLRCSENTTSVYFFHGGFVTGDQVATLVRLDEAPPETHNWNPSTNYQAAGIWSGGKAIPFIKRVAAAKKMVIRIEDRSRIEGIFDLGNVQEAATKVAAACKWAL